MRHLFVDRIMYFTLKHHLLIINSRNKILKIKKLKIWRLYVDLEKNGYVICKELDELPQIKKKSSLYVNLLLRYRKF